MMNHPKDESLPQSDSVEHIVQILNDVLSEELPVSDAVDSLAYWFHAAFSKGEISVEQGEPDPDALNGQDIWT